MLSMDFQIISKGVFFIEVLRDIDNSYGFEMNMNNQMLSDATGKSKFMLT
ncbi:hypothetical protein HanRHA438_Chr15g0729211 [Helianthus annuus]|nr:hypothetical protein HanRHA438_Chr15g0729211 [Helianthus annuus]